MRMIRKATIGMAIAVIVAVAPAGAAFAASNPSGSGQPGAECGAANAGTAPAGFASGGFAIAEAMYAGSDGTHSLVSGNTHAVSQYDVACFQLTSSGH
jgi:hypothetical protein